jgi:hypothetical protein
MKGAKTVWRHAYRYYETRLFEYAEQPKGENHSILTEAYSPRAQMLAANGVTKPLGPAEAPPSEIRVESLAEGLIAGLQARQEKWL